MSSTAHLRTLYEYNRWANEKLLKAAEGLSQAELRLESPGGFGSLAETLRHIVSAQRGWLCFWTGTEWSRLPELPDGSTLETLGDWFRQSGEELAAFVEGLDERAAERLLTDTDDRGVKHEFPLWALMMHVVNHGTQHRAEIAMALTVMGRSPGDVDLVDFMGLKRAS